MVQTTITKTQCDWVCCPRSSKLPLGADIISVAMPVIVLAEES